jgi:GNAT superfamily N-acetyltransferase
MSFQIRLAQIEDIAGVVALQQKAFPPPFDPELHWDPEHIEAHIRVFPLGQWVAVSHDGTVIGSCSNTLISEERWNLHAPWYRTVGGPSLEGIELNGNTLYGLDISVDPDFRRQGVGRSFYEARFEYVRNNQLTRYGTACRIPGFVECEETSAENYVQNVVTAEMTDRTLTPLLRYGLTCLGVIENYMPDPESLNHAALLEWKP